MNSSTGFPHSREGKTSRWACSTSHTFTSTSPSRPETGLRFRQMNALLLPPPPAPNADQSDYVSTVAVLERLVTALGARARETGLVLATRPERTDDLVRDETALRGFCADALRQFQARGETTAAIAHPTGPGSDPSIRSGSLTDRAAAARAERCRQEALRQSRLDEPKGPRLVCDSWCAVALARLEGRDAIHRSQIPVPTLTDRCREEIDKRRQSSATVAIPA